MTVPTIAVYRGRKTHTHRYTDTHTHTHTHTHTIWSWLREPNLLKDCQLFIIFFSGNSAFAYLFISIGLAYVEFSDIWFFKLKLSFLSTNHIAYIRLFSRSPNFSGISRSISNRENWKLPNIVPISITKYLRYSCVNICLCFRFVSAVPARFVWPYMSHWFISKFIH